MDLQLTGKRALVCASSKGLGFGIARVLHHEGAAVVLNGRDPARVEEAVALLNAGAQVFGVPADVGTLEGCERLVSEARRLLGGIDILVCNSGGPPPGTFQDLGENHWQQGIEVTLLNAVRCIRLVLPEMVARRWGRVVTVTSTSQREPIHGLTLSNALRPAVAGLHADLSRNYGKFGITFNCVAPGPFETERQAALLRRRADEEGKALDQVVSESYATVPAGRHGKPEELGYAVAFLCSDRAAYINGEMLFVDGGLARARL